MALWAESRDRPAFYRVAGTAWWGAANRRDRWHSGFQHRLMVREEGRRLHQIHLRKWMLTGGFSRIPACPGDRTERTGQATVTTSSVPSLRVVVGRRVWHLPGVLWV